MTKEKINHIAGILAELEEIEDLSDPADHDTTTENIASIITAYEDLKAGRVGRYLNFVAETNEGEYYSYALFHKIKALRHPGIAPRWNLTQERLMELLTADTGGKLLGSVNIGRMRWEFCKDYDNTIYANAYLYDIHGVCGYAPVDLPEEDVTACGAAYAEVDAMYGSDKYGRHLVPAIGDLDGFTEAFRENILRIADTDPIFADYIFCDTVSENDWRL